MISVEHEIIQKFERKAFWFRNLILISATLVVTSFIVTARYVQIPNAHNNAVTRKTLPFRFFVDVYEEPWFTLVSILQNIVAYTVAFEITAIETVSLYHHDGMWLSTFGKESTFRSLRETQWIDEDDLILIREDVINCAKFHQKIMLFCAEIEKIMRQIFLITIFTTVYNMSITGYKLLENDPDSLKFLPIFLMNLLQFFAMHWSPECLLVESQAIGDAAYFATFKTYRAKTTKTLRMMILRAQRPVQLTAGGYINLSIQTFGIMIRNAFSFFAVLRNFRT